MRDQIGHIGRNEAAKLASYMVIDHHPRTDIELD